jgi:hypothetical protein
MRFSIAVLYKSTAFHSTVLLFVAANFWSWLRHKIFPICCDQELSVGFPFPYHVSGGFAGTSDFYLLGLLLDVVTALTVAVLITWIVKLFRG